MTCLQIVILQRSPQFAGTWQTELLRYGLHPPPYTGHRVAVPISIVGWMIRHIPPQLIFPFFHNITVLKKCVMLPLVAAKYKRLICRNLQRAFSGIDYLNDCYSVNDRILRFYPKHSSGAALYHHKIQHNEKVGTTPHSRHYSNTKKKIPDLKLYQVWYLFWGG